MDQVLVMAILGDLGACDAEFVRLVVIGVDPINFHCRLDSSFVFISNY